jgi:branched-chain amino acid transport system permease protein
MGALAELLFLGITLGLFYGLVALPIVLVYKTTKVFNFAHGGLMFLGAYIFYFFYQQLNFPWALAGFFTLLTSAAVGYIIRRALFDPIIAQPILSLIVMTLVLGVVVQSIVVAIWGDNPVRYEPPVLSGGNISLGIAQVSKGSVIEALVVGLALAVLSIFFARSKVGLAMMATSEDHHVAQSLGIGVRRIFGIAWIIGMIMAAAAGFFAGHKMGLSAYIPEVALRAFAVVLLGGLESMSGAIVGGLIVGMVETLAAYYLGGYIAGIGGISPFVILLAIMLFKPYGLFGWERIERI